MTRPGWIVAVLAPAAVVAAAAWPLTARSPHVDGTPAPAPEAAAPPAGPGVVGQGGCASAGCHGAPAGSAFGHEPDENRWASSALVWLAADPHRRAYEVLTENHEPTKGLATRMMSLLYPDRKPEDRLATKEVRCLACHTNPTLATATDAHSVALRAEGVSCEACHGNAGGWLYAHTGFGEQRRKAGFSPDVTADLYRTTGMAPLYDLGQRALACAGCHVGAPEGNGLPLRDMNHDMIAAGHPKLNFDFATYQFMLPRHWFERDRTKPGSKADPDFDARAWLVGRVAHAETACRLTADRARRADPWPEFAESSCVACHHRLNIHFETDKNKKERGPTYPTPDPAVRKLGSLPWQPIWPVTRAESFAALAPGPAAGTVEKLLKEMQVPRPPLAARATAATAADELAALRGRLTGLSGRAAFAAAGEVLKTTAAITDGAWDRDLAEQVYYGRTALERARIKGGGGDPARFVRVAEKLRLDRGTIQFFLPPDDAKAIRDQLK
ncbi:hypothetical protein J0H58_09245 [bacterium]|nr:hypothetical protein [bacterium]